MILSFWLLFSTFEYRQYSPIREQADGRFMPSMAWTVLCLSYGWSLGGNQNVASYERFRLFYIYTFGMNKKIILSIAFVCSCLGIKAQSAWFGGVYTNSNSGISSAVMGLGSTLINMGINSLTDSDSPLCSYDPYSFLRLKVHIKSVWEKNEESLLVISYFPHFG